LTDEVVASRRSVLLITKVAGHLGPYHLLWLIRHRYISVDARCLTMCFAAALFHLTGKGCHPIHILIRSNIPIYIPVNICNIHNMSTHMEGGPRHIGQVPHNSRGSSVLLIDGNHRRRDRLICPSAPSFL
jgi:hypothetical protein